MECARRSTWSVRPRRRRRLARGGRGCAAAGPDLPSGRRARRRRGRTAHRRRARRMLRWPRRARMMLPAWLDAEGAGGRRGRSRFVDYTPPSCTAGWSTPPAGTGSTPASRSPPRVERQPTGCWSPAPPWPTPPDDPFALAEMRTGLQPASPTARRSCCGSPPVRLRPTPGRSWSRTSPGTMRARCGGDAGAVLAAGGGALGSRDPAAAGGADERIAAPLADEGLALYAQHATSWRPATGGHLRRRGGPCLLGTDAVRDGVDVPGPFAAPPGSTASPGRDRSAAIPAAGDLAARGTMTRSRGPASPRRSAG